MNHEIEGYTDKLSYNVGESVQLALSSLKPEIAKWRMYRIGWYDGRGARLIEEGSISTTPQVLPPVSTWDVPCVPKWPVSVSIPLAPELVSGVYAIRLDIGQYTTFMTFTVREDDRLADIVYQRSDFTDTMYNNWDGTTNRSSWYGDHPEYVSLNRVQRSPTGSLFPYSAGFFSYEVSMVRFLEREGYDVTYISNLDVHQNPHALDRGSIFLSAGHDEYWTKEMRDTVENARDAGKHLAIFSSDTCDAILRLSPEDATLIAVSQVGATYTDQIRQTWGNLKAVPGGAPHDNPEDTLIGTHYAGWCGEIDNACLTEGFGKLRDTYEPVIQSSSHPVFRGLSKNAKLGHIVGYEFEVHDPGIATPGNLQTVAATTSIIEFMTPPAMVAYQTDGGAKVFNVGSMHFSHGLDRWAGAAVFRAHGGPRSCESAVGPDCFDAENEAAQQMTINVLSDMGAIRHSPRGNFLDSGRCDWNNPAASCVGTVGATKASH